MKLKYEFIVNVVADKFVAVAVGDGMEKFSGFIKMNDIGAEIFEVLKENVTEDELVSIMSKKHSDISQEEVRECVVEFVAGLKAENLIDE